MEVAKGANMPFTAAAKSLFRCVDILFAPGNAANAGGVGMSGLKISQKPIGLPRDAGAVNGALRSIMSEVHAVCIKDGTGDGKVDYAKGTNIAGFWKVADAMVAQGVGRSSHILCG